MKKSRAEPTPTENLEEKFDRGEDVLDYFDLSKAHVPVEKRTQQLSRLTNAGLMAFGPILGLTALLAIASVMLGACSKAKHKEDAGLQTALDELTKLDSYTQTGLDYAQYNDRLLTAKANIDVALQRTTDSAAHAKIEAALSYYIQARDSWKQSLDKGSSTTPDTSVRHYWGEGSKAIAKAKRYVVADEKTRRELDVEDEKEQKQSAARWEQEKKASAAKESEQQEKRAKEAEQQRRAAEAAERERARRFSPDGVVYNLKQVTVTLQGGLASIPPGTELRVARQNSDGTLQVQKGDLFADVQSSDVTNDRDLAAALRARDSAEQEALRQWAIKQGAAAAELERWKYATPTPRPR
jgi:hypothetical protein